jgi:rubrerythrin
MQLGTFGAIFSFALELERQAADLYEHIERSSPAEAFTGRAERVRKRIKRLERMRREAVTEMILEVITGLEDDDYRMKRLSEADVLAQAMELEGNLHRFYLDAAEKMPVREVARIFERMARENEQHLSELREIQTKG